MNDLGIIGGKIFDGFRSYRANVYVKGGRICAITSDKLQAKEVYDARDLYVMPGLIDPHVHFALSLGKYRSADDFESGSIGAAFGGITTYIDFLDPVTRESDLENNFQKRLEEAKRSHVDYAFHNTIAHPNFSPEKLVQKTLSLGINSIKTFTTYSTSDRMTDDGYIFELLRISRKYGIIETFHAENDAMILYRMNLKKIHLPEDLPFFHPFESESSAVVDIALLSKITNGQSYIVHNSSGRSVELLKKTGLDVKLETCPQYLILDENDFKKMPPLYTLVPPLRSREDRELMDKYFLNGAFDAVGTDHCPFKREEKIENISNYDLMPNGIGGIETSFVLLYTFFSKRGLNLNDLVRMQSVNVARIFGLDKKGKIEVGADADLSIFDPSVEWKISISELHTKSDYTPYEGIKVKGKFVSVLSRGKFVVRDGEFIGGNGKFVRRGSVFWRTP